MSFAIPLLIMDRIAISIPATHTAIQLMFHALPRKPHSTMTKSPTKGKMLMIVFRFIITFLSLCFDTVIIR